MSGNNFEVHLSFNSLGGGFLQAFMSRSRDRIMAIFEKEEANEGIDSWVAQMAAAVHPEFASTDAFCARQPYANPEFLADAISDAEERGWVTVDTEGFKATKKSQELYAQLAQLLEEDLSPLAELVSVDIPELVEQLASVVDTAEEVPLPIKETLKFARNYEYGGKEPSLVWARRHLLTIGAYRDDCHLSSWKKHDLPGYLWETLSFIWGGENNTAEKMAEILTGYRGYTKEDYQEAIDQLIGMGWVEAEDDHYTVTKHGRAVREESEELTNEYYMKCFEGLTMDDLKALNRKLETLVSELAPEPQAEG